MNYELKRRVVELKPTVLFGTTPTHLEIHVVITLCTWCYRKPLFQQNLYKTSTGLVNFSSGLSKCMGSLGPLNGRHEYEKGSPASQKITLLLCKQWTAGNTDKKTFHLFTIPFAWSQHLLRSVGTLWKWLWKSNYRGRSIADSLCYWILLFSTFVLTWICLLRRPQSQTAAQGNFSIQCHLPKKYIKINTSKYFPHAVPGSSLAGKIFFLNN